MCAFYLFGLWVNRENNKIKFSKIGGGMTSRYLTAKQTDWKSKLLGLNGERFDWPTKNKSQGD